MSLRVIWQYMDQSVTQKILYWPRRQKNIIWTSEASVQIIFCWWRTGQYTAKWPSVPWTICYIYACRHIAIISNEIEIKKKWYLFTCLFVCLFKHYFLTNRERNISGCFLNYFYKLTPSNNFWKLVLTTDEISYCTRKSGFKIWRPEAEWRK
jgi:hypothetical protein